jgi:hypothetical protein
MIIDKTKAQEIIDEVQQEMDKLSREMSKLRSRKNQYDWRFRENYQKLKKQRRAQGCKKIEVEKALLNPGGAKVVIKKDLDGNEVDRYASITSAATSLAIEELRNRDFIGQLYDYDILAHRACISKRCNRKVQKREYKGYLWEFEDESLIGKRAEDDPDYKRRKMESLLNGTGKVKRKDGRGYIYKYDPWA